MGQDLHQIREQATKLRDSLRDGEIIDLNSLREFYKELDDFAHRSRETISLFDLADFDREIVAANAHKRRLLVEVNKLLEDLAKSRG
jgi:hypothetical protein